MKRKVFIMIFTALILIMTLVGCSKGDNYQVDKNSTIILNFDKAYENIDIACPSADIKKVSEMQYTISLKNSIQVEVIISGKIYETEHLTFSSKQLLEGTVNCNVSLKQKKYLVTVKLNNNIKPSDVVIEGKNVESYETSREGIVIKSAVPIEEFEIVAEGFKTCTINLSEDKYIKFKAEMLLSLVKSDSNNKGIIFINDEFGAKNIEFSLHNYAGSDYKNISVDKSFQANIEDGQNYYLSYNNKRIDYFISKELVGQDYIIKYISNYNIVSNEKSIYLEIKDMNENIDFYLDNKIVSTVSRWDVIKLKIPSNSVGKILYAIKRDRYDYYKEYLIKIIITEKMINTGTIEIADLVIEDAYYAFKLNFVDEEGNAFDSTGIQVENDGKFFDVKDLVINSKDSTFNYDDKFSIKLPKNLQDKYEIKHEVLYGKEFATMQEVTIEMCKKYKMQVKFLDGDKIVKLQEDGLNIQQADGSYILDCNKTFDKSYHFKQSTDESIMYDFYNLAFHPKIYEYNNENGMYYVEIQVPKSKYVNIVINTKDFPSFLRLYISIGQKHENVTPTIDGKYLFFLNVNDVGKKLRVKSEIYNRKTFSGEIVLTQEHIDNATIPIELREDI